MKLITGNLHYVLFIEELGENFNQDISNVRLFVIFLHILPEV